MPTDAHLSFHPFACSPVCLTSRNYSTSLINTVAFSFPLRRKDVTVVPPFYCLFFPPCHFSWFHQLLLLWEFHSPPSIIAVGSLNCLSVGVTLPKVDVTVTAGVVVVVDVITVILVDRMVTFFHPLPLPILSQARFPISSTFSHPVVGGEVLGITVFGVGRSGVLSSI